MPSLEIGHSEQRMLLLVKRLEVADLSEIGVIFKAEPDVRPNLRASRAAGAKSASPNLPKPKSTIGLTMNSYAALRTPIIGLISIRSASARIAASHS